MMNNDPIVIEDKATPFLQYMIEMNPEWFAKAMKSFGWYMKKQIKANIKTKAPGGNEFARFMDPRIRAQLEGKTKENVLTDIYTRGKGWKRKYAKSETGDSVRYPPLGKLQRAIGYQYDQETMQLMVGYLSNSALKLGTKMEKGFTKTVTEDMRRFFWAHGVPISPNKTKIKVPARPVMQPMRRVLMPQLMPYIETKLVSYWYGKTNFSPSAPRKYRGHR